MNNFVCESTFQKPMGWGHNMAQIKSMIDNVFKFIHFLTRPYDFYCWDEKNRKQCSQLINLLYKRKLEIVTIDYCVYAKGAFYLLNWIIENKLDCEYQALWWSLAPTGLVSHRYIEEYLSLRRLSPYNSVKFLLQQNVNTFKSTNEPQFKGVFLSDTYLPVMVRKLTTMH